MKCPPYLVRMRVDEHERKKVNLWLPLFPLWPLLFVIIVLLVVAAILADLIGLLSWHKTGYTRFLLGILGLLSWHKTGYTRFLLGILGLLGETRGTEVFVQDRAHAYRTVAFTLR